MLTILPRTMLDLHVTLEILIYQCLHMINLTVESSALTKTKFTELETFDILTA